MKNYFFERGRDFFDVFLSRALARDKKTSKKSRSLEKKFFFHQILLFIAYYTQIEYLGSFIPHDRVLNTPVAYDLYFNHKQLLKIQKLIYHLFCKVKISKWKLKEIRNFHIKIYERRIWKSAILSTTTKGRDIKLLHIIM